MEWIDFAERDEDDEPVPLGEVLGRDPPASSRADDGRAEVVDRQRDEPDRDTRVSLEEAREDDEHSAGDRGRGEPDERAKALRLVANDGRGEHEMQ